MIRLAFHVRLLAAALLFPLAFVAAASAETPALPKPGLAAEWRQTAFGHSARVRQEVVAVNGSVVSFRESTPAMETPANAFKTWRGLILLKRHVPQSATFTESTLTFAIELPRLETLLPLAPGRRIELSVKGRSASRLGVTPTAPFRTADIEGSLAIAVERSEAIIVPAGRFETVVIRHQVTIQEVGMDKRTTVVARVWFAPALGWPVKKQQLDDKGAVEGEAVLLSVTGR